MGFESAPRRTTADFLTALTSPGERRIIPSYEALVPRTAEEFAEAWKSSKTYQRLLEDISRYNEKHPISGPSVAGFVESRRAQQAVQQ